ncbi:MAG TPA: hypothetical protein VLY63_26960, partial [Anaerolineae bacterium]|nr:hypothetical protein [Anaerolineae bacterium]
IYSGVEPNLAVVGLWGALVLLSALAFSYLAIVQGLGMRREELETEAVRDAISNGMGLDEQGAER